MRNFKVVYGFLENDFYEKVKEEINLNDSYKGKMTKGLRSHYDILEQNITTPYLKELIKNYANNPKFWKQLCEDLHINIGDDFEDKFKEYIEPAGGLDPSQGDKNNQFFYSRFDVGYGMPGYGVVNGGRGVHIDNKNRVISALLYFGDQSEYEGGEFDIANEDGSVCQRISLRDNLCIMSAQNKNGWHKVNPLKKLLNNRPRIGIYFALSSNCQFWER